MFYGYQLFLTGKVVSANRCGKSVPVRSYSAPDEPLQCEAGSVKPKGDLQEKKSLYGITAGAPEAIVLFVVQRCNLRCTYCCGGGGQYDVSGSMDEKTFMHV